MLEDTKIFIFEGINLEIKNHADFLTGCHIQIPPDLKIGRDLEKKFGLEIKTV